MESHTMVLRCVPAEDNAYPPIIATVHIQVTGAIIANIHPVMAYLPISVAPVPGTEFVRPLINATARSGTLGGIVSMYRASPMLCPPICSIKLDWC